MARKETGIRLKDKYNNEVVPALIKEFGYKNVNEVPKIEKIVLNMGLGDVKDNSKSFNIAVDELAVYPVGMLISSNSALISVTASSVTSTLTSAVSGAWSATTSVTMSPG